MKKQLSNLKTKISNNKTYKKVSGFFHKPAVSKTLSVLKKIKKVFFWSLFVILVAVVAILLITRVNGYTPTLFGYSMCRISSGSMEPQLKVGDIIINKSVDDINTVKVGDIITYEGTGATDGMLITHKVIKAPHKNSDGVITLQTQGIANKVADSEITPDVVQSSMVCKMPYIDTLYNLFLSPWGLLIFIAILIIIFVDELIFFIRSLTGNLPEDNEKKESIGEIIERIQREELEKKLTKSKISEENDASNDETEE